jgi:hypothetical protein
MYILPSSCIAPLLYNDKNVSFIGNGETKRTCGLGIICSSLRVEGKMYHEQLLSSQRFKVIDDRCPYVVKGRITYIQQVRNDLSSPLFRLFRLWPSTLKAGDFNAGVDLLT